MAKILVVDDHPLVRKGTVQALMEEFPRGTVEEASDAPEAMQAVWNKPLDLVLLDLFLPGRNGLDVLKEIKAARPNLPVLILSSHAEDQFATRVLKAGGAGYLTKDSPVATLLQAVRRAMEGGKFISPATAERLAIELTLDTSKPLHEQLSNREFDILLRIASGQSISEIGDKLNLSVKTISTYRSRLLIKMGKRNNAELTQYAIRNKLIE